MKGAWITLARYKAADKPLCKTCKNNPETCEGQISLPDGYTFKCSQYRDNGFTEPRKVAQIDEVARFDTKENNNE